jgi:glycoside/pentoside/hexuronide:cation symporter, GPH family
MKQLKRWQEPIYAIGGFGPGFLYQIVLTYLLLYYRPALQLLEAGAVVLAPAAGYAAGMFIARATDGVIDLPIASWTDNMKSKWGRRRPLMVLGLIPTAITFILLWYPPITGKSLGANGHWGNTAYVAIMSSLFFFFYTLIVVPYLASLSEIVQDENSRVRVASWQTFFNTAGYVLTFVVAPIMFDKFGIRGTAWILLPSILSFIGPILVIKEDSTLIAADDKKAIAAAKEEDIPLWESFKLTLANKTFRIYIMALATFFFGLQFFLGGIAFMALDMMGLTQSQLGTMNAAAFAPVPIMLLLFNYMTKKKGAKWAFRLALLVFAVVMLGFPLAWNRFDFPLSPYMIGIILGAIASFSIGVFFTIPYAFPAHIAAIEAKETGKDRAGMYFAVQGLINQFVGSLARSILALLFTWEYGVVLVGPIAAVACIFAFFIFKPYPLGQPTESK